MARVVVRTGTTAGSGARGKPRSGTAARSVTSQPASTIWPVLMLPVRLEARRIEDDLCIRVFPDQPFVNTHQESLTQDEHDGGLKLAAIVGKSTSVEVLAADETARAEWRELARRYGPCRAAWILRSLRENPDAPTVASQSAAVPSLFLQPERFVFLVYQDSSIAYEAVGNPITRPLSLLPDESREPPGHGLFDSASLWVTDFQAAVDAGLGVRIRLCNDDRKKDEVVFSELVAIGVRAGGETEGCRAAAEFIHCHRYTEGIEFLAYGTPTNNTSDTASGYSDSDDETDGTFERDVLRLASSAPSPLPDGTAGALFANALGLKAGANRLAGLKGSEVVPNAGIYEIMRALWGSTGDYFFSSILGYRKSPGTRRRLVEHAATYVRPRGHLPALRIGNQPYGILPAGRIRRDASGDSLPEPADESAAFDAAMGHALDSLLPHWLTRARDPAFVPRAGASGDPDEEIVRILAMSPHSVTYRTRPIVDQKLIAFLMTLFDGRLFGSGSGFEGLATPQEAAESWAGRMEERAATSASLLAEMGAVEATDSLLLRAFAWGPGSGLPMPLVRDPREPSDGPEHYLPRLVAEGAAANPRASNSLLYDLLRRSLETKDWPAGLPSPQEILGRLVDNPVVNYFNRSLSAAGLTGLAAADPPATLPPQLIFAQLVAVLAHGAGSYESSEAIRVIFVSYGQEPLFDNLRTKLLAAFDKDLEAGLRDAIDALTCRLDAWYTSLAWKTLTRKRSLPAGREGLHWGAYGYLEDLHLPKRTTERGQPAVGGGYIHAPSLAQASAAALLRCAYDTHRAADADNPYALDLTSGRVARAMALIEGVQQGLDLTELLGYQFERALHNAGLDRLKDDFRKAFPLSGPAADDTEAPTAFVTPRNVCDGRAVGEAFGDEFAGHPEIDRLRRNLGGTDRAALDQIIKGLVDATDAVGDLLLFEGVYQAVQGNYDRAGSALDASAGLGKPPEIRSVATPRDGTNLRHRICVLLPTQTATGGSSPGARGAVEPRLDAWVGSILGPLEKIGCRVYSTGEPVGSSDPPVFPFNLAMLDPPLGPLDFLYMCHVRPKGDGNSEIESRIRRHVGRHWTSAGDTPVRLAVAEAADESSDARCLSDAFEVGRSILDMLGRSTPLTPAGLMHPDEVPDAAPGEQGTAPTAAYPASALAELKKRIGTARDHLAAQSAPLTSDNPDVVRSALDQCAGYGIQEAVLASDADPDLGERATQTAEIARQRLAKANAILLRFEGDLDTGFPLLKDAAQALFGEAFVLVPWFAAPADDVRFARFGTSFAAPGPARDRVWLWLQQVAETHPRVRTLETMLMCAEAWGASDGALGIRDLEVAQLPLRPEVDWQALADGELPGEGGRTDGCQSIVAMVPEVVDPAEVAGFVIDEWTETIPAATVTTGVSFEYNQPSQQAPQCILLAVAETADGAYWTRELLAGIVRDSMDLARARLVDLDALPESVPLAPALLFPIAAPAGQTIPIPGLLQLNPHGGGKL